MDANMIDIEDLFAVLPKHIELSIRHNPHRGDYMTVADWVRHQREHDGCDIEPEDEAEMLRTGEIWMLRWYPETPVGHCEVAAATLHRALELAGD